MMSKRRNKRETAQRFSLRKSAFGATSVLLGSVFLMEAGLTTVQADMVIQTQETDNQSQDPVQVQEQAETKEGEWQEADKQEQQITTVDIPAVNKEIQEFDSQLQAQGIPTDRTAEEVQLEINTNLDQQDRLATAIGIAEADLKTTEADLTKANSEVTQKTETYEKLRKDIESRSNSQLDLTEAQAELDRINAYIDDVEKWNGEGIKPYKVSQDDIPKVIPKDMDSLYSQVEWLRILSKSLEAELKDSKAYAETKDGQYAIVRRVADIYDENFSLGRRTGSQASVIYTEGKKVETPDTFIVDNYEPTDMASVSEAIKEYLTELRRLNGLETANITISQDALNYAENRALEIARLSKEERITKLHETTLSPYKEENVKRFGGGRLTHKNLEFIHSDREFAYYLLLDWFADYENTNLEKRFGHTAALFRTDGVELGLGYLNPTNPNTKDSYRDFNLDPSGTNQVIITYNMVGDSEKKTTTVQGDNISLDIKGVAVKEKDTVTGLEETAYRFRIDYPDGVSTYRSTSANLFSEKDVVDGKQRYVYFTFFDEEQPHGEKYSTSDFYSPYEDKVHSQLGEGKEFTYTFSTSDTATTYFRKNTGEWFKLSSDGASYEKLVEVSESPTVIKSKEKQFSDAVFLPKTDFIYSITKETYDSYIKRVEEGISNYKRWIATYLTHENSPLRMEKEKLEKALAPLPMDELNAAKKAMDDAKAKQQDLVQAKSKLESDLQGHNQVLTGYQTEENNLKELLSKLQGKSALLERLEQLQQNKTDLENKKKQIESDVSKLISVREEKIPFGKGYQDDATLYEGKEEIRTPGQDGIKRVSTNYALVNGKLQTNTTDTVIKSPVNAVIARGTKPSPTPVTVTEYRVIADGVQEYQVTKLEGKVTEEKEGQIYRNTLETKTVAYTTIKEDDATLTAGTTKVKQAGVNGSREVGVTYTVENGQLKKTPFDRVVQAAVDEIILVGTRQPVRKTETSYRAIANGVEEYATDYVDDVQSGQPRLVKTHTNAQAEVISFEKVQEEDATLPVGETRVKQAGVNGSRLVGKLYSVENGQLKVTEVNEVTAAIPEITLIGTRQPVRKTETSYRAIANGVEEYATDYVDDVQSGQPRLVKTYTNVQAEVIPFEKVQEEDTSLPVGETKVKQAGVNGSRRVGKLYSVENGQLKVTEVNEVTAAIPEITLIGTRQPVRKTETSYRAIANGVEEYVTDYVDDVQSGQPRLVKTYTNTQAEVILFDKVQEEDTSLPVGETKVKQAGVNGSRRVGKLYSVEDGQLKVTEVNEVTAAIPEITLVGTRQPEQVEVIPSEPSQESETPVAEQPTQPEQVKEVPTSPSSEPETPVVEQPTQSELEQAEVVPVEPETETPAVEQPTQLEPEQVEVVPTEPVEQPEPATQPDEELVTAVPDTAPQEDEKPEYIFNPDDFKDVLEPEVEEKADASTEFSRFAGTWVNSIGQSFTISETGAFSGHFNENHVVIHNTNAQGVVVFSNGGPSVVLPSYLPAGYTDAMTTNSDGRLERFVFMGDAWADNRGAFPETAFFYRLGEKPVLAATEETIPTVANGGGFAGAGALTEPVVDAVAFPAATSQEPATVVAESALPNTGDAVSLISLLGASMVATAGVGVKRRRR